MTSTTSPNCSSTSNITDKQDTKLDCSLTDSLTTDANFAPDQSVACELVRRRVLLGNCEGGDSGGACGSGDGVRRQAGFFEEGWRSKLCSCPSCKVRQRTENRLSLCTHTHTHSSHTNTHPHTHSLVTHTHTHTHRSSTLVKVSYLYWMKRTLWVLMRREDQRGLVHMMLVWWLLKAHWIESSRWKSYIVSVQCTRRDATYQKSVLSSCSHVLVLSCCSHVLGCHRNTFVHGSLYCSTCCLQGRCGHSMLMGILLEWRVNQTLRKFHSTLT